MRMTAAPFKAAHPTSQFWPCIAVFSSGAVRTVKTSRAAGCRLPANSRVSTSEAWYGSGRTTVYPYFVLAHCPFGVAEGVFVGAALGGRAEGDAAMSAGLVAVGSPLADGVLCGSRSSANAMMATTVTA